MFGLKILAVPENLGMKVRNQSMSMKNSEVSLIFLEFLLSLNSERMRLTKILAGLMTLCK